MSKSIFRIGFWGLFLVICLTRNCFGEEFKITGELSYKWTSCPINGGSYITTIAVDSTHSSNVYIAANISGVLRSTDYAERWQIINNSSKKAEMYEVAEALSIADIAIDPKDSNILYRASGVAFGVPKAHAGGIFKSVDQGETWDVLTREVSFCGHGLYQQNGHIIAIDPENTEVIYAGSYSDGIFKSIDQGTTWKNKGLIGVFISNVILDPEDPKTIYVAGRKLFDSKGGIYRSTDGGDTWTLLKDDLDIYGLAINPKNPEVLYIACQDKGIYKSTDGGKTWKAKNNGLFLNPEKKYTLIAINPVNPSVLYAFSQDGRESFTKVSWSNNLYKTTDGGETWKQIPEGIWYNVKAEEGYYYDPGNVCWFNRFPTALAIDPKNPERIYYACGLGIWRSDDGGKNWQARSHGAETADCFTVVLHPKIPDLLYAAYGERGLFWSKDGGKTMKALLPDAWSTGVLAINKDTAVPVIYYGSCCHYRGLYRNVGGSLQFNRVETKEWNNTYLPVHVTQVVIDPSNSDIQYVVVDLDTPIYSVNSPPTSEEEAGIYRSEDAGETWERLDSEVVGKITIDPTDSNIIYLAKRGEKDKNNYFKPEVYKSIDRCKTWKEIDKGLPASDHSWSTLPLVIDPKNPEVVYIGYYTHGVYKTGDGGDTWENIFPDIHCNAIAIDQKDSSLYVTNSIHLRVGTATPGIYKSNDKGKSWHYLTSEGLGNFLILNMVTDPFHKGRIYVGLGGNNLFMGEPIK